MLKSITVRELIEALEGENPDALVVFTANYGDYHRTMQALPVRGEIEQVEVVESAYSNSGYAISDEEDLDEDDADDEIEGPAILCIK